MMVRQDSRDHVTWQIWPQPSNQTHASAENQQVLTKPGAPAQICIASPAPGVHHPLPPHTPRPVYSSLHSLPKVPEARDLLFRSALQAPPPQRFPGPALQAAVKLRRSPAEPPGSARPSPRSGFFREGGVGRSRAPT